MNTIEIDDIVQLDPIVTKNKMFAACLMIVTDIKPWGVQGYVQSLGEKGEPGGQAYYRAETGTFRPVGAKATWVVK